MLDQNSGCHDDENVGVKPRETHVA